MKQLAPDGMLAFHVSNRCFDLPPVPGNMAKDADLDGYCQHHHASKAEKDEMKYPTVWAVLVRKDEPLAGMSEGVIGLGLGRSGGSTITFTPGAP